MNYNQIFIFAVALIFTGNIDAQTNAGTIKYKQTIFFESDNMPADMPKSAETFSRLLFNGTQSLFEKDPDVKVDNNTNENSSRMFRRMRDRSSKTTYKNIESGITIESINLFGKDFLIQDTIEKFKWKVSAGEQKVIAGYTCMKASYKDSLTNLIVYFTPQIPKKFGPDKYGNLPGVILEVQSAQTHIIATEIITDVPDIKIPSKGDKMTRTDFEKMRKEKTKEMRDMFGQRGGEMRVIRQ